MKKFILSIAVVASSLAANAQQGEQYGFCGDKFLDNWYVGINAGVGSATVHNAFFKNLNPNFGVRLGKLINPTFGFGLEANAFLGNKLDYSNGNYTDGKASLHYLQFGLYGTVNLMNAIGGYYNTPRDFEVSVVPKLLWGRNYGEGHTSPVGWTDNQIVTSLGLQFAYNFGSDKQWQVYAEPSMNWAIAGILDEENGMGNKEIGYNINASFVTLNFGINYKFKTSNGTHNFQNLTGCNTDDLNNEINLLREKNEAQAAALQRKPKTETVYVHDTVYVTQPSATAAAPNLPSVFFQCNKSVITTVQKNNVRIAAEVLKKYPEYNVAIKGYASVEGAADNNNSLGVRRANAVKDMLIKTYGIDPKRITATGCGATDEFSPVLDLNRVSMMVLEK